jgi:hypothetical protein
VEVEKEDEQYEVEEILNHKTRNKKKYCLVKWIELLHPLLFDQYKPRFGPTCLKRVLGESETRYSLSQGMGSVREMKRDVLN